MGVFSVDLAHLDGVVQRLRRFEVFVEDRLNVVDARVAALHGSWRGDAARAQLAAHEEWLAGARRMREAAAVLGAAAATAHDNYRAAAHANSRGWTR